MSELTVINAFAGSTDWLKSIKQYSRNAFRFAQAAHAMGQWSDEKSGSQLNWGRGGPLGAAAGLVCDGARGRFWFGLSDWSALHPALAVERDDIPAQIRAGLMESAAQQLIGQLQHLVGGPVAVVRPAIDSDALTHELALAAHFEWDSAALSGSGPVQGLLRTTISMLDRAEALAAVAVVSPGLLASLPVYLPVQAGISRLSVSQFQSLRIGDVLRPTPPIAVDQPLRVEVPLGRHSSRRLRARVTQQSLILESYVNARIDPPPVTAAVPDAADSEEPLDLGDVDLEVAIEIGQLNATVGQLSSLKPGQALPLARGINPASVRLTVRNQVVATGELVAVGDEFAVMIKSLGGSRRGQSA